MFVPSPEEFAAAKAQEERRAMRRPVSIRAQLRPPGSDRLMVDVTDLSETGFQIKTVYRLQVGATVWLAIPSLSALEAIGLVRVCARAAVRRRWRSVREDRVVNGAAGGREGMADDLPGVLGHIAVVERGIGAHQHGDRDEQGFHAAIVPAPH